VVASRSKKNGWKMLFNLGAFLAGATAGYFFSKAEDKFSSFGENVLLQIIRALRNGGEHGSSQSRSRSFSRRSERRGGDPDDDSVGDRSGFSFQDEDENGEEDDGL
jgi:hypothetical protein